MSFILRIPSGSTVLFRFIMYLAAGLALRKLGRGTCRALSPSAKALPRTPANRLRRAVVLAKSGIICKGAR